MLRLVFCPILKSYETTSVFVCVCMIYGTAGGSDNDIAQEINISGLHGHVVRLSELINYKIMKLSLNRLCDREK